MPGLLSCHGKANHLFTTLKYARPTEQTVLAPVSSRYDEYSFSRSEAMPSRCFHTKSRHGCKQCKARRVKVRLIRRYPTED